jgi:hypothetical protein
MAEAPRWPGGAPDARRSLALSGDHSIARCLDSPALDRGYAGRAIRSPRSGGPWCDGEVKERSAS